MVMIYKFYTEPNSDNRNRKLYRCSNYSCFIDKNKIHELGYFVGDNHA